MKYFTVYYPQESGSFYWFILSSTLHRYVIYVIRDALELFAPWQQIINSFLAIYIYKISKETLDVTTKITTTIKSHGTHTPVGMHLSSAPGLSMRNPGSNRGTTALEVVIIKGLLVKDPLESLYYFNNGSSQLYCFQRSLVPQRWKGSSQGNAVRTSQLPIIFFRGEKGGVGHTSLGVQVNLMSLL